MQPAVCAPAAVPGAHAVVQQQPAQSARFLTVRRLEKNDNCSLNFLSQRIGSVSHANLQTRANVNAR